MAIRDVAEKKSMVINFFVYLPFPKNIRIKIFSLLIIAILDFLLADTSKFETEKYYFLNLNWLWSFSLLLNEFWPGKILWQDIYSDIPGRKSQTPVITS